MIRRVVWTLALCFGACVARADDIPADQRRSTYDAMGASTRAMQDDDASNPATLWALDGASLWSNPAGAAGKSCADCHGPDTTALKSVSARYPRFDADSEKPVDIEQRINLCRTRRQNATPLPLDGHDMLALAAFLARGSRGAKIDVAGDARAAPFVERGKHLFTERRGQLNLSCAQCHDDNWGKSLGGATIPQGHPTAYPIYRLEWQTLGSLRRRLRNCLSGMRAELWPTGASEYVDLELYLMSRANGMIFEGAGVRP